MQNRILLVQVQFAGMTMALGEFKITNFVKKYDYTKVTENVCPECNIKPETQKQYRCSKCGTEYSSWRKLKRVLKGTTDVVEQPRLVEEKEKAVATIYKMDALEFAKRYSDATKEDKGIVPVDTNSVQNLMNLVVAVSRFGQVIVLKWNETRQQNVALLGLSPSNRVILKEIVPRPLAQIQSSMVVDLENVTEEQITLARQLIENIPEVTDEVMTITDYRTTGMDMDAIEDVQPEAVQSLQEVLIAMKAAQ